MIFIPNCIKIKSPKVILTFGLFDFRNNKMNKDMEDARAISAEIVQEISNISNQREGDKINFALLIAGLILQDLAIYLAMGITEPGSEEGARVIKETFKRISNDSVKRWKSDEMKSYK